MIGKHHLKRLAGRRQLGIAEFALRIGGAFPDMAQARQWYASPGYRAILPLRLRNASSNVFLAPGVDAHHAATDVLRRAP
ncbi:DUF1330 domain-containing protein [Massilia sp. S19_KUP03_FR1]|uniref:DUF1330 domain-containing protein n=1 Tax=Massilia sp. S19_KUP03_FR1 TaxID=3025503 RepID=UPI002FCD9687